MTKLGAGIALGARQRSRGHLARALARLLTPAVRERCRAVATLAQQGNGLEVAADQVEELGASRGRQRE